MFWAIVKLAIYCTFRAHFCFPPTIRNEQVYSHHRYTTRTYFDPPHISLKLIYSEKAISIRKNRKSYNIFFLNLLINVKWNCEFLWPFKIIWILQVIFYEIHKKISIKTTCNVWSTSAYTKRVNQKSNFWSVEKVSDISY